MFWLANKMGVFLLEEEADEYIPIIREALCHIAIDLQMVIASPFLFK